MMRIRGAVLADAAAIARVHVETWRATYAGILPDHALVRMTVSAETVLWRRALMRGDAVFLAEAADAFVVGFGSCGRNRLGALPFTGEVFTLYVHQDFQGLGIGRQLLDALFRQMAGTGHDSTLVWVLDANPARHFYEAMGGMRIAEREEHLWGRLVQQAAYGWRPIPELRAESAE